MELLAFVAGLGLACVISAVVLLIKRLWLHPLKSVPGPWSYAISSWRLAYDDLAGQTSRIVHDLHSQYGPAVRTGPTHVSFDSLTALKSIYGVGSRSNRTLFYKIFEPYGRPTMFTMSTGRDHAERKKYLIRAYSKTGIVKGTIAQSVESKVKQFLDLVGDTSTGCEICQALYFFTIDVSTAFVYTPQLGTAALTGDVHHRALVYGLGQSKRGPKRSLPARLMAMFMQYLGSEEVVSFKEVRAWALKTFERYRSLQVQSKGKSSETSLVGELCYQQDKREDSNLQDIDLASECADHLAAGIETMRNTLLFLLWALSLPENVHCQVNIRNEVSALEPSDFNEHGLPTVEGSNKLLYVNAVIKESLRLYAPLPQLQPRFFESETVIDGYPMPANTTVSMALYTQHRNAEVYPNPYEFKPERWLHAPDPELQRWWWPFSNGGRACTGMQ